MKVRVRLFGPLAEQAGRSELEVTGATVGEVVAAAAVMAPSLRIDPTVRFAVNTTYADPGTALAQGDVVSLIPPVGGG